MKKVEKRVFIILLIVIGSFLSSYVFTFAKYASDYAFNYYFKTKDFYFSSDHLGSSIVKNVDNLWDGGSVHFNVKNNHNQEVITDYDIAYSVVCTITGPASTYTECRMNGSSANTFDGILTSTQICRNQTTDGIDVSLLNEANCQSGGYDWVNQITSDEHYFDVVLTGGHQELTDVTVNIIATSNSPYRKILSGDFKLHKVTNEVNNVSINYKNYSNYDGLVISNSYPNTKCVKVSWNASNLLINAESSEFSSYLTDANGYIREIKINISGKSSLGYIYYKRNFDITYNVSEFSIEESTGC